MKDLECGCGLDDDLFVFCRLHDAAPKLLRLLKEYHSVPCPRQRIHVSDQAACGACEFCQVISKVERRLK